MVTRKRINIFAIMIILLPIIIYYYLDNFKTPTGGGPHADFHLYYVIISSTIAFLLGVAGYLEYKKSKVDKIFYISIGLIGVSVFYTFHALITPNMTIGPLFEFPDPISNISAFVMFGDVSRFWLALMMFLPDNLFEQNHKIRKYFNGYVLLLFVLILSGAVVYGLLTPEVFPLFKNDDLTDTGFAILTKVVTVLLLGSIALRYYYSYKAKSNITTLSFIVGLVLIMETVIIFMISKPWSLVWWLAHNLFLMSYIVIGLGVLYSYFSKEKYGFFDVFGQIKKYTKLLEEKNIELDILANYDALTGLSNRRHFMTETEAYIKKAEIDHSTFAFMFIDLDYFKQVNDKYGHKIGDELLKILSKKISSLIKSTDIASRVGGDEFVLLIKDVNQTQIEDIAKRIIDKMIEPVIINENKCIVGASIGISMYPTNGNTIENLISKSDEAMYSVKKEGRNNYKMAI
jgi:diguanylate cyclase (GGDEF)-like protein